MADNEVMHPTLHTLSKTGERVIGGGCMQRVIIPHVIGYNNWITAEESHIPAQLFPSREPCTAWCLSHEAMRYRSGTGRRARFLRIWNPESNKKESV